MSIVESHHPDSAIINPLLEFLLAKKPEIEMLRLSYGIDVERLKIDKLKRQMMLTISIFKLNVKMLSNSNDELDMHVVQNAINKHFCYLNRCRNDKELNQKIAGFLDLMDSNIKLAAAMDEFDLMDDVTKIKIAHSLFNQGTNKRVAKLSKRPNISTKNIIKDLFDAIDNLFKGLEVAQVLNSITVTEADFSPLICELSQLSDMYYKSFSIRKANNKRKFEKKQQSGSVINEVVDNEMIDESENVAEETAVEEETSVKEPTTAMISMTKKDENKFPLQVYEASIEEWDVGLGKARTFTPAGGKLPLPLVATACPASIAGRDVALGKTPAALSGGGKLLLRTFRKKCVAGATHVLGISHQAIPHFTIKYPPPTPSYVCIYLCIVNK